MDWFIRIRWCSLLSLLICHTAAAAPPVHHELHVTLTPDSGYLEATDQITLQEDMDDVSFVLHAGLDLHLITPGTRVVQVKKIDSLIPLKQYQITLPSGQTRLEIKYSGTIQQSLKYSSHDYSGGQESTAGIISAQGVFLSLSSFWFPVFDNRTVTFVLHTTLPEGWTSISQGQSIGENVWQQPDPQDDIYLIAGKYHIYRRTNDIAEAQVYLLQPDQVLAERYLKATEDYLKLFSKLLGPYPYPKFALVENIWESGYGMPSFTLLGSKVIRLPFILNSSYPHEILHNWWGNGVFVDYSKGNWSEGISTYLADHLIKEQEDQGSLYRRDALQSYTNYVTENEEYALKDFRGHHGQVSQAIGYGKGMMFMHMLRMYLGDETFLKGLRLFYKDNLFKTASYAELQQAMQQVARKSLAQEFQQWTGRTGAPALELTDIITKEHYWGYQLSFTLRQTQKEEPFRLMVPVYIHTKDEPEAIQKTVAVFNRETRTTITLKERPLSISVDPLFDLFRHLDPSEIPSSLGQLFGAEKTLIILPSQANAAFRTAYEQAANSWKLHSQNIRILWDDEVKEIPPDQAAWLFGKENLLVGKFLLDADQQPMSLQDQTLQIDNREIALAENSFVLTNHKTTTIGWLHSHSIAALPGLMRKIPHYGKYSYLAFTGDNPDNILKGLWPLNRSSLNIRLVGDTPGQNIPEHRPLSDLVK